MKSTATGQQVTQESECQHDWTEIFDADADAACYNDGLNYRPAEEICTKCGRKQKIKYEDETKWYKALFWSPLIFAGTIIFALLTPIVILIAAIKDAILANKRA